MLEVGKFVTLKLRNIDRNGKFIKGHMFVSGDVVAVNDTTVTLEVTHHNDWHGTSQTLTHNILRKRIMAQAGR